MPSLWSARFAQPLLTIYREPDPRPRSRAAIGSLADGVNDIHAGPHSRPCRGRRDRGGLGERGEGGEKGREGSGGSGDEGR